MKMNWASFDVPPAMEETTVAPTWVEKHLEIKQSGSFKGDCSQYIPMSVSEKERDTGSKVKPL